MGEGSQIAMQILFSPAINRAKNSEIICFCLSTVIYITVTSMNNQGKLKYWKYSPWMSSLLILWWIWKQDLLFHILGCKIEGEKNNCHSPTQSKLNSTRVGLTTSLPCYPPNPPTPPQTFEQLPGNPGGWFLESSLNLTQIEEIWRIKLGSPDPLQP